MECLLTNAKKKRFALVAAIAVSVCAGFVAISRPSVSARGNTLTAAPESRPLTTYRWNLNNSELPLLRLPDHLSGTLDLAITYALGEFQFPLFQSLYYNERAGKYILMVLRRDGSRAEFIDLNAAKGRRGFAAPGNLGLRLDDDGAAKVLTTAAGVTYRFALFANGEFHCRQIMDHGLVMDLRYSNDSSLEAIIDNSGRSISFGYHETALSSLTQTWGHVSGKQQTWAVVDSWHNHAAIKVTAVAAFASKRIPANAVTHAYTREMATSDLILAGIFGGPSAVAAANGFEPIGLANQYPFYRGDQLANDGRILRGHLSYALHLYGNASGTAAGALYIPRGFVSHSNTPTPTDAAVTFYYPRLGNLSDVTLAVFHIADFHLSDEGQRVRVGNIGGPGGSNAYYRHSHIEIYRGNTGLPAPGLRARLRLDPTTVLEPGAKLIARTR
jgi:hypothetical protein